MESGDGGVCGFKCVLKVCFVAMATLCSAAKVAVSVYGWFGEPSSLALTTPLHSAMAGYRIPISPADWVQGAWLLLFAWEVVWLAWAWLLLCCRHTSHTVCPGFYPAFVLGCLLHTGCVFALGRQQLEVTFALLCLLTATLLVGVAILAGYLYYIRGSLKYFYPKTLWLTRVLVLNGTVAYATFTTIWLLFALGAVISAHSAISPETVSTIILSLLSSLLLTYFLLESSILDPFLRYVFAVYPVVLWVLAATLAQIWQDEDRANQRNRVFALVLACVTGTLILLRAILWAIFACARPLAEYEREEPDALPL